MFVWERDGQVVQGNTNLGALLLGVPYLEVDNVPDRKYRDAWKIVGDLVVLDPYVVEAIDDAIDKVDRMEQLETLTVTTSAGNEFDADIPARDALVAAVTGGDPGETTPWKLANNTVVIVSWEELREALRMTGFLHTSLIAVEA